MIWLSYALISALLLSLVMLIDKKILLKEHAMEFVAVFGIFTVVVSMPLFIIMDYSELKPVLLLIIFFISILWALSFILYAKSIRHMEISTSSPLLVLSPGVVALIAFIFLKEKLTLFQIFGIGLLIIGAYILETKRHHSLLEPLKIFEKSRYVHYLLLATLLFSIAVVLERYMLSSYNIQPQTYIPFLHLFMAIHFLIMLYAFHNGMEGIKHGIRKAGWWIFLAAILTIGHRLAQATAVQMTYVGLVIGIKKMSSLITTVVGGELFHEKNIFRKSIACLIMIGGVLLIVL